ASESLCHAEFGLGLGESAKLGREELPQVHPINDIGKAMPRKNSGDLPQALHVFYSLADLSSCAVPPHPLQNCRSFRELQLLFSCWMREKSTCLRSMSARTTRTFRRSPIRKIRLFRFPVTIIFSSSN